MKDSQEFKSLHRESFSAEQISPFIFVGDIIDLVLAGVNSVIEINWAKTKLIPFSAQFWIALFDTFIDVLKVDYDRRLDDVNIDEYDMSEAVAAVWDFHSNHRIERKPKWELATEKDNNLKLKINIKSILERSVSNVSPKSKRSFNSKKTDKSAISPKKIKKEFIEETGENMEFIQLNYPSHQYSFDEPDTEEENKIDLVRKRFEERTK